MRLKQMRPSYDFGSPQIMDIYEGLAKGSLNTVSDEKFITNPNSPSVGVSTNFVDNKCAHSTAALYKTALESCLQRQRPFVSIVRVSPSAHPIGPANRQTQYDSYSNTNTGNYISTSGGGHYIVIVGMNKVFDDNWNLDLNQTTIYFLDPYWNAKALWETTYSKLVNSVQSAGVSFNGFGFL